MLVGKSRQGTHDRPALDLPVHLLIGAMMVSALAGAAFGSLQGLLGG